MTNKIFIMTVKVSFIIVAVGVFVSCFDEADTYKVQESCYEDDTEKLYIKEGKEFEKINEQNLELFFDKKRNDDWIGLDIPRNLKIKAGRFHVESNNSAVLIVEEKKNGISTTLLEYCKSKYRIEENKGYKEFLGNVALELSILFYLLGFLTFYIVFPKGWDCGE